MKTILAWHFTDGMKLRDGRPLVVGETLKHDGPLVPCESGLHASIRPIDALRYAPGSTISRVECGGETIEHGNPVDKFVCRERRVIWTADADTTLRAFARRCASDVLHLWAAPDIVKEYLTTGDESKRAAARAAAMAAARDAARDEARDEARDAARGAAWDAARAAAWDAARDAARDAAWDAAWDAALTRYNVWLEEMLMELEPAR